MLHAAFSLPTYRYNIVIIIYCVDCVFYHAVSKTNSTTSGCTALKIKVKQWSEVKIAALTVLVLLLDLI